MMLSHQGLLLANLAHRQITFIFLLHWKITITSKTSDSAAERNKRLKLANALPTEISSITLNSETEKSKQEPKGVNKLEGGNHQSFKLIYVLKSRQNKGITN